MIDLTFKVDSN